MKTRLVCSFVALLFLTAGRSRADTLPDIPVERVLLPLTVKNAPGAFGTQWTTELWLRLDTTRPSVFIMPLFARSNCDPPCPLPGGPLENASFPVDFFKTAPGELPGSLLYVQQDAIDDLFISLRLLEVSGFYSTPTLQLPVVRERDFSSRRIHILGIPGRPGLRGLLRVYGIDPDVTGDVRVAAFREEGGQFNQLLFDMTVPLTVVQREYAAGPFRVRVRPPVAQLDLSWLIPVDVTLYRLEITPVSPGLRIWGFASVTDNATQEIVLRTPR